MARYVFDGVVEILEEFNPSRLAFRNFLWFSKVHEVLVIHANSNWLFASQEVTPSFLEPKNDAC